MGLDHVNKNWDTDDPPDGMFQETSFTRSGDAQRPIPGLPSGGISAGDDGIPGSYDDFHEAEAGNDTPADNVGWYRKDDNDPVIVDAEPIDSLSFTRKINAAGQDLPPGHTWAANANREVTRNPPISTPPPSRPAFDTTAVMYSLTPAEQEFHALSADEVNMVKMGMTGMNREIGGGDDYTIELIYVDDCASQHDVMILYDNLSLGVGGQCLNALIDYSYTQNPGTAQHFSQTTADPGVEPLFIQLNQNENYDLDPPSAIFVDGLESDVYPWSSVVP